MNRLISMVMKRVLNMAVQKGMNASAQTLAGPDEGRKPTKEQKAAMKRARQSAKMMGRMTRF